MKHKGQSVIGCTVGGNITQTGSGSQSVTGCAVGGDIVQDAPGWEPGEQVTVVEYRDQRPAPGGMRFGATVTGVAGAYVTITYADPAETGREHDQFYASSGWRAWDGELRWKLHKAGNPR